MIRGDHFADAGLLIVFGYNRVGAFGTAESLRATESTNKGPSPICCRFAAGGGVTMLVLLGLTFQD